MHWAALGPRYIATAREVIASHEDQLMIVLRSARFMWNDRGAHNEAVSVLTALDERNSLGDSARYQLVTWLHHLNRYRQSIPHLEKLLEHGPDNLNYRVYMVYALAKSDKRDEALALVEGTEARFTDRNLWNEGSQAQLAEACLQNRFHEHAARYYEEAIRNRERRGQRVDSTLAGYYGNQARAFGALGKYDEAIDAASAAVVAWGGNVSSRERTVGALESIFRRLPNLDAWVEDYGARVAESGMDAPLLRRSIGKAYLADRDLEAALTQFKLALELQDNDRATLDLIVKTYDQMGQNRKACDAILAALALDPRQYDLIQNLAERFAKLGDEVNAERANSSLVEHEPNSAEGHRRLAVVREKQRRFPEAVVQWQEVVRVRSFESEGWFGLAEAQIRAGDQTAAHLTLETILAKDWPERSRDVRNRASQLMRRIR